MWAYRLLARRKVDTLVLQNYLNVSSEGWDMKTLPQCVAWLMIVVLCGSACIDQPRNSNSVTTTSPSPSATESGKTATTAAAVTLPVLNALFADETFKAALKSKLQLTDDQISSLQKSANDEVARLRETNAEEQSGSAAEARRLAADSIGSTVGEQKAQAVLALVNEHWVRGGEELEADKAAEFFLLPGPNAIPQDSRIVVNIPAYRMDLFQDGSLVKSYRIGIGYPAFPLPTGLRKAQQIIFNPTWTPPDEPWVNSMKGIKVGEKVEAGSSLNPLGPVKIPIGMPSLIHGGKSPAKLGTFASHGCVGMTNAQVKDFARLLAKAAGTEISDKAVDSYLTDKTKTRVVKLGRVVPVELRYETIVVEDGKLYIYKDVYDQNSNTEENLRTVLGTNGLSLENLTEEERAQVLGELNAMSTHPKKQLLTKATNANAVSVNSGVGAKKSQRAKKVNSRKERVVEIGALLGKGYPAPVNIDAK
jgi:lipoprotein-anchoring transpeptidase ErfK/SrfK